MHPSISRLAMITLLSTTVASPAQDVVFKNSGAKAALIELYSSEGCSSCPPAEAWVSSLKTSPGLWKDLFPVAFHVDYWDGLGWPDRFAKPVYTQRQRNYAAALGQDSVYTPEFVVNGREWRGWFHGQSLPGTVATSGELSIHVADGGKSVSAAYAPSSSGPRPSAVNVALLGAGILSDVRGGENGGRKLEHDFIVLDFASKPLTGKTPYQTGPVTLTPSTSDAPAAIAAWVSAADGSVLQMAGGWLNAPVSTAGASP
jgi:hypothetical protein